MKNGLKFCLGILGLIAILGTVAVFENKYVNSHIMEYTPTNEEIVMIADEYGIILDDKLTISSVLLDYSYPNQDAVYAIRIVGAEDVYSFLNNNIQIEGDVTVENGSVLVNDVPIMLDERIDNYERDESFSGGSVSVMIWGGHNASNNGNPYTMRVTISFFFENDELVFIEIGSRVYPFGDECSGQIRKDHYWEDFIFYQVFPLFK